MPQPLQYPRETVAHKFRLPSNPLLTLLYKELRPKALSVVTAIKEAGSTLFSIVIPFDYEHTLECNEAIIVSP